ncbi:hypothetical protein [Nitrospirillum amazonense]|uniref:hypothetical protein n=1 Tax=Nitrospirillum amazonense TaxID=28077 RepID=UPI0024124DF5|nr:hypothetical protein [Nitrospirillum amazonense]MDG3444678.1 hypothetical protein [Nitrospirillum amazonense]
MVAYSFKPQFEMPILSLRKTGTIRNVGKRRHAQAGQQLQFYTGMRTMSCRLIASATCLSCDPITVDFATGTVTVGLGKVQCLVNGVDAFAHGDGFESFQAMAKFWRDNHRASAITDSVWIRWDPQSLRPAAER